MFRICKKCKVLQELDALQQDIKEKEDYILDLEEECENLSEYNRQLIERIKDEEQV